MKKLATALIISLAVLPACRKRPWSWRNNDQACEQEINDGYKKGDKKSLFVDDVDAFVLEEDSDPFAGPSPVTMKLTAHDDEAGVYDYASVSRDGFKTIYFDFAKAALRDDQKDALFFDVKHIKELITQGHTIVIEGHACEYAGSHEYNLHLSQERADAIKNILVTRHGISKHKFKTVGRGSEMCIVPSGSKEQQAPNRRVEFYILK